MAYSFAAILFALVLGSFGQEAQEAAESPTASLLQVSQSPALQGQQQATQTVPQVSAAQAQLRQSPVALASANVHNSYSSAAPIVPVLPSAGSLQAPLAPNAAALAATASRVKSIQAAQVNETALAFSQLSSLDTEFQELHADDASHVRQLTYNVHLREQLQEKLRQAEQQLMEDNERLADHTMQIIAGADVKEQPHSDNSQASANAATAESGNNETFAALLLEAAVVSRRNRELNNAQIAAQALDRVKSLVDDIASLRARDEEELQALKANAQSREALHKKIELRSDQLHQDTNLLVKDLADIRDLVAKDDSSSNGIGPLDAAPSSSAKQEPAQAEAAPNA